MYHLSGHSIRVREDTVGGAPRICQKSTFFYDDIIAHNGWIIEALLCFVGNCRTSLAHMVCDLMKEILEFIKRRFDCDFHWMDGNCYYFALILKDRFPGGKVVYDVIYGHFMYFYDGKYYDWTGETDVKGIGIDWDSFDEYDSIQKQNIIRDCLM